jgi:hypothetical protein
MQVTKLLDAQSCDLRRVLVSEAQVVDAWLELRLRRATVLTQVVTRP